MILTCVCKYVCMYDLNEIPPDPPGLWPFHIRDYIPDFIVFINNLVQPHVKFFDFKKGNRDRIWKKYGNKLIT